MNEDATNHYLCPRKPGARCHLEPAGFGSAGTHAVLPKMSECGGRESERSLCGDFCFTIQTVLPLVYVLAPMNSTCVPVETSRLVYSPCSAHNQCLITAFCPWEQRLTSSQAKACGFSFKPQTQLKCPVTVTSC